MSHIGCSSLFYYGQYGGQERTSPDLSCWSGGGRDSGARRCPPTWTPSLWIGNGVSRPAIGHMGTGKHVFFSSLHWFGEVTNIGVGGVSFI